MEELKINETNLYYIFILVCTSQMHTNVFIFSRYASVIVFILCTKIYYIIRIKTLSGTCICDPVGLKQVNYNNLDQVHDTPTF